MLVRERGKSGQARRRVWHSFKPLLIGIWLLPFSLAGAEGPVTFGTKVARLWVNESQVLAFSAAPGKEKQVWETRVEPANAVEILQPATQLENQKTGFLRLRALQPGKATLQVGRQSLPLQLTADSVRRESWETPEIITPRTGAMLYGTVTVGVQFQIADAKRPAPEVTLRVGETAVFKPRAQTLPPESMDRIYAFDLDADQFPPGPLKLQASVRFSDGRESLGDSHYVYSIRPNVAEVLAGDCVDKIYSPRPERMGQRVPKIQKATGKAPNGFVVNNSPDPAWCLLETIAEPGWYQFFVRARGTPAAGSYPSVGLLIDDRERPDAATRLVDREWQRVAVGAPVFLAAGPQILTARYLNDFQAAKDADRNLHLQRYELVRVSPTGSPAAAKDSMAEGTMMDSAVMTRMAGAPAMAATAPTARPGEAPLAIAFAQPFHGRVITGPVVIRAQARWAEGLAAPRVDLLLNGSVQASQYGADLDFRMSANAFQPGENRLQLRAEMPNGIVETTPVQNLIRPEIAGVPDGLRARSLRYQVLDPAWDPGMRLRLEKVRGSSSVEAAAFYSNGESRLQLPVDLAGDFRVRLEARGQEFQGPPIAQLLIQSGELLTPIGEQKITGGNQEYAIGRIHLPPGPKQLVVRYGNDLMEDAKKDRNWWLKSIRLEEIMPSTDEPPEVAVRYAPPTVVTSATGGVDAVVAEVFSNGGIQSAELRVDGRSQPGEVLSRDGFGRFVFPLMTRGLAPGIHHLQVRAVGRDKRETVSPRITFKVVEDSAKPGVKDRYARAIHLLNRFGYGPEPEELADILLMGELPWLRSRLAVDWSDPGEQAAMAQAEFRFPNSADRGGVSNRTLLHLLLSPNAVRSRFVMWTENHFSTWIQKTEAANKWQEHERFLELGVAPFGDLLLASATSPAMLVYLDQFRSLKGKLNENYAREIMELHTVGVHAGYTQEDVTNLAGLLTGWTLSADASLTGSPGELVRAFRYEPAANHEKPQRIFGMEFPATEAAGRFDRARMAVEMLAAHPATAQFISRKLAEHYVGVPAPDPLVNRLADRFRQTGGDMRELVLEIARSPEFWANRGQPKLATPLDYGLRLCRQSGTLNPGALGTFLNRSGMGLFDCATPNGYPEADAAYADSNALLQRWNFSKTLQEKLPTLLPASYLTNTAIWTPELGQGTLDLVAARLLGRTLSERSNQAALSYLQQAQVPPKERFRLAATFITQLPENNLR